MIAAILKRVIIGKRDKMFELEHDICGRCGKNFAENDEIVYCPECGTPVHRDCWTGECENLSRHQSGYKWESKVEKAQEEQEKNLYVNEETFEQRMEELDPEIKEIFAEQMRENYKKFSEKISEPKYMGVSEIELYNFIGANSLSRTMFYSRIMKMISTGKKWSFNVFSGFLLPFYQLYNRMNLLGTLLVLLQVLLSLPEMLLLMTSVTETSMTISSAILNALPYFSFLTFICRIIFLLYGDYFYLMFAVRKIKRLREAFGGEMTEEYFMALKKSGRPQVINILFGLAVMLISPNLIMLLFV